jgi:protein-S-isoprenylcysteine O-methyltransferase Ste14
MKIGRLFIPPPFIFLAGLLAGLAVEAFVPIDGPSTAVRIAAAAIGVAAMAVLDFPAMRSFQRAGTGIVPFTPNTALVTSGPFRFTRNPMYVGMAILYAGLAIALGIIWAFAFLPIVLVVVDRRVIAVEEGLLEAEFGDQYRQYKSRVRRWL